MGQFARTPRANATMAVGTKHETSSLSPDRKRDGEERGRLTVNPARLRSCVAWPSYAPNSLHGAREIVPRQHVVEVVIEQDIAIGPEQLASLDGRAHGKDAPQPCSGC